MKTAYDHEKLAATPRLLHRLSQIILLQEKIPEHPSYVLLFLKRLTLSQVFSLAIARKTKIMGEIKELKE